MSIFKSKMCRVVSVIVTVTVLTLCFPLGAFAATGTGIYLGSGNVNYANGDINYDVRGYVYYNSNTSTYLDLSALCQWVYNYGVYDVDEAWFEAHDGNFNEYTYLKGKVNAITTGKNARLEADWASVAFTFGHDTVYQKNTQYVYAYTSMVSGYSNAGLGGWSSYWWANSREDDFHY